jgi:hypothetical protein
VRTKKDKLDWTMKYRKKAHLTKNQEDKLVSLRMLQRVLYTTRHESLTNPLSKYE